MPFPKNPTQKKVTITSWGASFQGDVYEENQDSFLNWPEKKFWSVADGVGGTQYGAQASKLLIQSFLSLKESDSLNSFIENTRKSIIESNNILYSQSLFDGSAASTVVSLLIHDGKAACLWAGDSRCYLLRNDTLYQCTHDHTLRQHKIDNKELTEPEAHRMIKGNIITNAVGAQEKLQLDEVQFALQAGDRILLCSDGLSNMFSAKALQQYMFYDSPKASCEALTEALNDRSLEDNVTFIIVFLSKG